VDESGSNVKESRSGGWKKNKQRKKEMEVTGFRVFVFPAFRGSLLDNSCEFIVGFWVLLCIFNVDYYNGTSSLDILN
jgi:hypothetical protein